MSAKHTPGPWRHWPTHLAGTMPYVEPFGEGDRICIMDGDPYAQVSLANARLIAAAPDLLAACERLQRIFDERRCFAGEWTEVQLELKAAIAKATGPQES